jgi:His/Glu/Gln/Arg/opine family amino acid ABC transporter permease subunit
MDYDWNFNFLSTFYPAFLLGTWVTIKLSITSFVLGLVFAVPMSLLLGRPAVGRLFRVLNDMLRAFPPLVLIFVAYYLPIKEVLGVSPLSPLAAAILGLAASQAAYSADVIRSAVESVPNRLLQAGRSIGMREREVWWYLGVPDVVRQTLPAHVAFLIGIIRLSSLGSVIGVQDSVYIARIVISQTFHSFEPWIVVAILYVVLVLPLTYLARRLESSPWLQRRL